MANSPLEGKYGLIFNYNNNPATLAHGAFNLRHTFSSKAQYKLSQRTTKNLLDYTNSTELWKYQWDLIHNPETILLGFMQNEEEGASQLTSDPVCVQKFLEQYRYAFVKQRKLFILKTDIHILDIMQRILNY